MRPRPAAPRAAGRPAGPRSAGPRSTGMRFAGPVLPGLVLALVVLTGATGLPAAQADEPPAGGTSVDGTSVDGPSVDELSVDEQVARAVERARLLRAEEQRQAATLPEALRAVEAAAADSAQALTGVRMAAEARREAVVRLTRSDEAVAVAEAEVGRRRSALAGWARAAYAEGGDTGLSVGLYALLAGGSTDDALTRKLWRARAGAGRAEVVGGLVAAVEASRRATRAAQDAAALAEAAAARAGAAARARDAVLAAQRQRLADLELLLEGTRRDAAVAEAEVVRLAAADLAAARLAAGEAPGSGDPGATGDCAGRDVSGYANGELPLDALCPVVGSRGELLRADAAHSFGRMSGAFAARFGRPLCVTDSYRSLPDQVRVRAERPGLAAVPGRSNHGWGTAADLCGGVERFGSGEHAWMRVNAPLFGWFHPAWARAGGTLPEAWHWEFSG